MIDYSELDPGRNRGEGFVYHIQQKLPQDFNATQYSLVLH